MQSINIIPSVRGPSPLTSFVEQDPAFGQPTPLGFLTTDFYCQANGSNLNAGSDQNAAAKFTSTNGNWSTVTNIFIPTDGTNPVTAGVKVGDYASIYIDGATVGVFISRITAVVNAANGSITVLAASGAGGMGTAPVTSATARTIKVGGALLGPNAASGFPFTLNRWGEGQNVKANVMRTNLKNDQTYSITASFAVDNNGLAAIIQGYSVTPGDGGKATIDGGTSTGALLTATGIAGTCFRDLIFTTSIPSGTSDLVTSVTSCEWTRCVFKGARGSGLVTSGSPVLINECEASNCNGSNTSLGACFKLLGAGGNSILRTIVHDCPGSNASGFGITAPACVIYKVICARIGQYGVSVTGSGHRILDSDFYKIGAEAIRVIPSVVLNHIWIENNNFFQTGIGGIPNGGGIFVTSVLMAGFAYNNAYGSNGAGDALSNIIESGKISYPAGMTPWTDPDNGDFSLSNTRAISTGRGAFCITQVYSGSTIGYPDVGAAARNDSYPLLDGIISGVTRDSGGSALGTCVVHLFRTSDDLKLGSTVSDGSGVFSLPAPLNVSCYLTAYLDGAPDVEGTSVNTLTGG